MADVTEPPEPPFAEPGPDDTESEASEAVPEECEAAEIEGPAKPTIFVVAPTRRQAPVPFTLPAKAA
ncbi:hypothetical protein K4F52_004989 [Lecanicillium sp. MT-2017a]|nr:hypothetical protein K4F52_004989 [Lecanicillium sp. MT-2017a]